jgi:hypothetical protein
MNNDLKIMRVEAVIDIKYIIYTYTVAYMLKARTVKPAETAVAMERLCKHARR